MSISSFFKIIKSFLHFPIQQPGREFGLNAVDPDTLPNILRLIHRHVSSDVPTSVLNHTTRILARAQHTTKRAASNLDPMAIGLLCVMGCIFTFGIGCLIAHVYRKRPEGMRETEWPSERV